MKRDKVAYTPFACCSNDNPPRTAQVQSENLSSGIDMQQPLQNSCLHPCAPEPSACCPAAPGRGRPEQAPRPDRVTHGGKTSPGVSSQKYPPSQPQQPCSCAPMSQQQQQQQRHRSPRCAGHHPSQISCWTSPHQPPGPFDQPDCHCELLHEESYTVNQYCSEIKTIPTYQRQPHPPSLADPCCQRSFSSSIFTSAQCRICLPNADTQCCEPAPATRQCQKQFWRVESESCEHFGCEESLLSKYGTTSGEIGDGLRGRCWK